MPPLDAHPFHISRAEAELNPRSGRLEVSLGVYPPDLARALSPGVDPEREPARFERAVAEYLRPRFVVRDARGAPRPFRWVGLEREIRCTWLYFEFPLPGGLEGVRIENSIFFELQPRQLNVVSLYRDGSWESFQFSPLIGRDSPAGPRSPAPRPPLEQIERALEVARNTWGDLAGDLARTARWLVRGNSASTSGDGTRLEPRELRADARGRLEGLAKELLGEEEAHPAVVRAVGLLQVATLAYTRGKRERAQLKTLEALLALKRSSTEELEAAGLELTSRIALEAGNPEHAIGFYLDLPSRSSSPGLERLGRAIESRLPESRLRRIRSLYRGRTRREALDHARSYLVNLDWSTRN